LRAESGEGRRRSSTTNAGPPHGRERKRVRQINSSVNLVALIILLSNCRSHLRRTAAPLDHDTRSLDHQSRKITRNLKEKVRIKTKKIQIKEMFEQNAERIICDQLSNCRSRNFSLPAMDPKLFSSITLIVSSLSNTKSTMQFSNRTGICFLTSYKEKKRGKERRQLADREGKIRGKR
jgi:hypothetical protein